MRKVTDIAKQKNNKNKFSIFINDNYDFSLYYEDLIHYNLKIGDIISDTAYNLLCSCALLSKAKQKALSFLSYKMRTEKEVKKKLEDEGFADSVIIEVLSFLKKYNYVNDIQYAKCYVKEKSKLKKHGKYKLIYDLKLKGVEDNLYEDILNSVDYNETAYELVCKRLWKKSDIDDKSKKAVYNYLIRKGYTHMETKYAVEKYLNENK